jgi:hypothetical protein
MGSWLQNNYTKKCMHKHVCIFKDIERTCIHTYMILGQEEDIILDLEKVDGKILNPAI